MTTAERGRTSDSTAVWLAVLALCTYAALVHHGIGPKPLAVPGTETPWWAPRGFLLEAIAESAFAPLLARPLLELAAFTLPALALTALVFAKTTRPAARSLALAATLAVALFAFYGGGRSRLVWSFFHWRGSVAMVGFAALVAVFALAPFWVDWARRWHPGARLGAYGLVFLALIELQRSVTGTDPTLPLAVSPWPVIPAFAIGVAAWLCAAAFAGVGLALVGTARLADTGSNPRARAPRGLVLLAAGIAFPPLALHAAGDRGLLPFGTDATQSAAAAAVVLVLFATAGARAWSRPATLRARGLGLLLTAALVALPAAAGRLLERWDYQETRETRAVRLIEALEAHFEREQLYPDSIDELVASQPLEQVPRPRFGLLAGQEFVYQSFGTSYLLEFSAPRWVQCQYNPPYLDVAPGERAQGVDAGAWSCPRQPPELW